MDEVALLQNRGTAATQCDSRRRRADEHDSAPGASLGLSVASAFYTDVAEIAEVSVENGKIRVHKVTCVLDCGQSVNPDIVRSQMEGGVIYGLTAALYGGLNLENGAIKESNFHDYPMLRMNESPEIEVIIIDSGTEPTGVGEPGLPPIAPAVANAVYKATGQRLRSLPLQLAKPSEHNVRWRVPPHAFLQQSPSPLLALTRSLRSASRHLQISKRHAVEKGWRSGAQPIHSCAFSRISGAY